MSVVVKDTKLRAFDMKRWVFAGGVLLLLGMTLYLVGNHFAKRTMNGFIASKLEQRVCVLGNNYSNLVAQLGEPCCLSQADGGNTFFYWPNHGIGVFCHPLYRGQFRNVPRDMWIITSLWIPAKKDVHQRIVRQLNDTTLHFERLLDTVDWQEKYGDSVCLITYYDENGSLESFEIKKKDNLWFDYYD